MIQRRFFSLISMFLLALISFAQRGYDGTHLYDLGLPDGDEVGSSLLKAIPFLAIGFLICWAAWWRKSKQESSEVSNWGCLGCLSMVVGGVFLLPLLAWVELIFQSALSIGIVIGIVVAVVVLVIGLFNKK